jgi:RNA polymerase sigma-70 factor, ECF subfamily
VADHSVRTRLAGLEDELPGLLRYARTLTADSGQAEDLVQDTVVRALEHRDSFRGDAALRTWLHRILHNLAVDQARKRREDAAGLGQDIVAQTERCWHDAGYTVDAATVAENAETRKRIEDALLRLPLPYRSAVLLHDAEGLTVAEIAQIQRIGLPAAKQRLRRGRMMLVTQLAPEPAGQARPQVPLRCWDVRARVSDYLDSSLPGRERALLERHLAQCATCPPLYAALVGVTSALGRRRDPDTVVPTRIAARIAAQQR